MPRPDRRAVPTERGFAGFSLPFGLHLAVAQAEDVEEEQSPSDAHEALAWLKEGNRRFAAGRLRHAHQAASWRAHLKEGTEPRFINLRIDRIKPGLAELPEGKALLEKKMVRLAGAVYELDTGTVRFLD